MYQPNITQVYIVFIIFYFKFPSISIDLVYQEFQQDYVNFYLLTFIIINFFFPGNLFNLTGAKWRNLRVKLTPTFTSGKMKMMFPTMVECGIQLQEHLNKIAESKEIETKNLFSGFTIDIIASCAFGIKTNALDNPNSEFLIKGKKVLEPGFSRLLINILFSFYPKLLYIFKVIWK